MKTQYQSNIESAFDKLTARFGNNFSANETLRAQHCHTTTWLGSQIPDAVVFVEHAQDVSDLVDIARAHLIPLIPFGHGSSLEGHLNAPNGGISVDFSKMNKIITLYQEDLCVIVEPGVTRIQLNEYLRDSGLFFPIDPGADATIGGMAATRASGTNAVRYGTMKDNIIALKAVMPNGKMINSASRAKKTSAGYDLTRLLIGSEGTLGIITELTVKLHGIPAQIGGAICQFETCHDACNAVIETIQYGINIARIEYLDEMQVRACNQYSKLSLAEKPTLLCEFHGSEDEVREQMEMFKTIGDDHHISGFQSSVDADERKKLWQARHDSYWACRALAPEKEAYASDVCVPISKLADTITQTTKDIQEMGLLAPIVGHVGDGNFHVLLLFDRGNKDDFAKMQEFSSRLIQRALDADGTCTGEHGIGQGKKEYLKKELGDDTVDIMRMIKNALDPDNLFNPQKIF